MKKDQVPRLRLADLIRRRRTTLGSFIAELGITTYSALGIYCARVGILPPTLAEFEAVVSPLEKVNSPKEGVVVLEAPRVTVEATGLPMDDVALLDLSSSLVADPTAPGDLSQPTEATQKKQRRKKVDQPADV